MMATLESARDAVKDIDGVKTCLIGFEAGISPADYPLIRIEPTLVTPGAPYGGRTVRSQIIFGVPITQADGDGERGIEEVVAELSRLEAAIRVALRSLTGYRYLQTLTTEEERSTAFRLWAIECELTEAPA